MLETSRILKAAFISFFADYCGFHVWSCRVRFEEFLYPSASERGKCMWGVGRKTVQHRKWNIGQFGFSIKINVMRKFYFAGYERFRNLIGCWPGLINDELPLPETIMTFKKFMSHLIVPSLAPALVLSLYFTPKHVFGCRNRGLMALSVVLVALLASIFTASRSVAQKKRGNTREGNWWLISTLILLLPLILLVGPLK